MPVICPTVLAASGGEFRAQMEKISHLSHRVQIDLTDGNFAPAATIEPAKVWWPAGFKADIHLMYQEPMPAVRELLPHKPHLIIIHAESKGNFAEFVDACRKSEVKVGVALLPETEASHVVTSLTLIDHVLIFSGDLGNFGGHADLRLLEKAAQLKARKGDLEIGWDGGVNMMNVSQLVFGGVDVLNVGGAIQNAADPAKAYHDLVTIAEETGTT